MYSVIGAAFTRGVNYKLSRLLSLSQNFFFGRQLEFLAALLRRGFIFPKSLREEVDVLGDPF